MEVVRVFNNELSSLYEAKPPISKAKMTQITKSAIKGIKFYKHIVQSVEKFIQKCRPEYKVPGLYVVDSIVRQSRHQFGADKDVFGPRFVKNINATFHHLFKCNPDDRSKIIRVLNLWQKNAVFPADIIQPLLDMGNPKCSGPNEPQSEVKESPLKSCPTNEENQSSRHKSADSQSWKGWPQANDEPVAETRTYAEMSTKNLEKFMKAEMSSIIEEEASRFRNQSKPEKQEENTVKFNKKLLDFDYGDEEDEEVPKSEDNLQSTPNALALSISQNLLSNPDLLRQLQQLSSIQQQTLQQQSEPSNCDLGQLNVPIQPEVNDNSFLPDVPNSPQQPVLPPPMPFPEASNMIPYQNNPVYPPQHPPLPMMESMVINPPYPESLPPDQQRLMKGNQIDEDERMMFSMPGEPPLPPQDFDERTLIMPAEERSKKDRSRSPSGSKRSGRHRSRSRSPRRKRSRSRSRSRKSSRSEGRERIHEKERERDRERERRKKGLPPLKKGCVSVCSTTLWLGHVPKSCTEGDISGVFGEYGTILSIDMIPPRGCAFVVMDRRQDANRAVQKLKNLKLQSSLVKMAWAPGKGVKGKEFKEYWDVTAGVSYVPCEKITENNEALDLLEEGGFIDEESLPDNLKELRSRAAVKSTMTNSMKMPLENVATTTFSSMPGPPIVPPPIIPSTTVNLPGMVLPHLMQPQFGLPLPGLLPHQAMVMQVPMGIPPPNPMLMVQQQSQNLLNPQSLPIGLPPMIPRAVPPVPNALQNFKNSEVAVNSPVVPAGDATPTDEDGTSVSSPSASQTVSSVSNSTVSMSSTQQTNSVAQFNQMLGLQNRPMMSVPPPVSSTGAPIPYPPPNVNFSFPPPGIRPPHTQFPWMQQKPAGPPFSDADSSQSAGTRPAPQPVGPPSMFGNRPFPDKPSNQTPTKESGEGKQSDDMEISGNRGSSPGHHDMVISTDDEASLDRDYPRNDVSEGPRFQGPTEFPQLPSPMHHPRVPMSSPVPMPGMHFPRGPIGSPFGMRMGGPRGMNMHPNHHMELDFPMHPGPRMPGGPRRDNMQPPEGRDWYPRDYDGPPFERENRFDRPRDSWGSTDMREPEGNRHSFEPEAQEQFKDRRNSGNYRDANRSTSEQPEKGKNGADESKGRSKPKSNKKPSKDLMDDMFKLRFYQRNKTPVLSKILSKKLENKKKEEVKENSDQKQLKEMQKSVQQSNSSPSVETSKKDQGRAKEGESRKRSRWGRTLSEEREIQEQRRFEIEIKFHSYESSRALPKAPLDSTGNNDLKETSTKVDTAESDLTSNNPQLDCDITNAKDSSISNHTEIEKVENDCSKCEATLPLNNSILTNDTIDKETSVLDTNTESANQLSENTIPKSIETTTLTAES